MRKTNDLLQLTFVSFFFRNREFGAPRGLSEFGDLESATRSQDLRLDLTDPDLLDGESGMSCSERIPLHCICLNSKTRRSLPAGNMSIIEASRDQTSKCHFQNWDQHVTRICDCLNLLLSS